MTGSPLNSINKAHIHSDKISHPGLTSTSTRAHACNVCGKGEIRIIKPLLQCTTCERSFHPSCHSPVLAHAARHDTNWSCFRCIGSNATMGSAGPGNSSPFPTKPHDHYNGSRIQTVQPFHFDEQKKLTNMESAQNPNAELKRAQLESVAALAKPTAISGLTPTPIEKASIYQTKCSGTNCKKLVSRRADSEPLCMTCKISARHEESRAKAAARTNALKLGPRRRAPSSWASRNSEINHEKAARPAYEKSLPSSSKHSSKPNISQAQSYARTTSRQSPILADDDDDDSYMHNNYELIGSQVISPSSRSKETNAPQAIKRDYGQVRHVNGSFKPPKNKVLEFGEGGEKSSPNDMTKPGNMAGQKSYLIPTELIEGTSHMAINLPDESYSTAPASTNVVASLPNLMASTELPRLPRGLVYEKKQARKYRNIPFEAVELMRKMTSPNFLKSTIPDSQISPPKLGSIAADKILHQSLSGTPCVPDTPSVTGHLPRDSDKHSSTKNFKSKKRLRRSSPSVSPVKRAKEHKLASKPKAAAIEPIVPAGLVEEPKILSEDWTFKKDGIVQFQSSVPFISRPVSPIQATLHLSSLESRRRAGLLLDLKYTPDDLDDILSKYRKSNEGLMAMGRFACLSLKPAYTYIQQKIAARGGRKAQYGQVYTAENRDERLRKGWGKHQNKPLQKSTQPGLENGVQKGLGVPSPEKLKPVVRDGKLLLERCEYEQGKTNVWLYGDGGLGKKEGYLEAQAGEWAYLGKKREKGSQEAIDALN